MSQNIYYTEWEGELGTYRMEFYKASDVLLTTPVYVEIPENVVIIDEYSSEFDGLPIGLAKAPTLKFDIILSELIDYDLEFRELFINSTKEYAFNLYPFLPDEHIITGSIVKLSLPGQPNFFIGVVKDDTDIDIDLVSGRITVECVHWLKVALDSINFERLGYATISERQYVGTFYEMQYEYSAGLYYGIIQEESGKRFSFVKLDRMFSYIEEYMDELQKIILREDTLPSFALGFPDLKLYRQNYTDPKQLGTVLAINDAYILATIENLDGSKIIGGLYYDENAGIRRYKSAWDMLSDYCEFAFARAYINFGYDIKIRTALGKYGASLGEVEIDPDNVYGGSLKLNYSRLSVVTASRTDAVGTDKDKFESSRSASRNSDEYTVPVFFSNVVPAIEWKKRSSLNWKGFDPHVWGLYYKEGIAFYKAHHYMEFALSNGKWSSTYPQCTYNPADSKIVQMESELTSSAKSAALLMQDASGSAKWIAEFLRAVYDKNNQAVLEDLEIVPYGAEYLDPYANIFKLDFGALNNGMGLLSENWLPFSFSLKFGKDERMTMNLITVEPNA